MPTGKYDLIEENPNRRSSLADDSRPAYGPLSYHAEAIHRFGVPRPMADPIVESIPARSSDPDKRAA